MDKYVPEVLAHISNSLKPEQICQVRLNDEIYQILIDKNIKPEKIRWLWFPLQDNLDLN